MIRLATGLAAFGLALPAHAATVAEIVVSDGLAMRAERSLHPDRPGPDFTEAEAHRAQILQDVRAVLDADDPETVQRFTSGKGPAGVAGEARYAAWQVTGFWLAHGVTVAEISRIKGMNAPARVAEAIALMLKEPRP